jgi:putative transposase
MFNLIAGVTAALSSIFLTRAALQLEILGLRHQIGVLQRSAPKLKLNPTDRLLWACLSRVWSDWRSALVIVVSGLARIVFRQT